VAHFLAMHDLPISNPTHGILGLAAFIGLTAAAAWFRMAKEPEGSKLDKGVSTSDLRTAALATGLAIGLASFGYLYGRFTGKF
jgi:hypothetical protein